jgi:hypothetical protein
VSWLGTVLVISIAGCQEPVASVADDPVVEGHVDLVAVEQFQLDFAEPERFAKQAFPSAYQAAMASNEPPSVFDTLEEAASVEIGRSGADKGILFPVYMAVFEADPPTVGGIETQLWSPWTISLHVEPCTRREAKAYLVSLCQIAGFNEAEARAKFDSLPSEAIPVGLLVEGKVEGTYVAMEAFKSFDAEKRVRLIVTVAPK